MADQVGMDELAPGTAAAVRALEGWLLDAQPLAPALATPVARLWRRLKRDLDGLREWHAAYGIEVRDA